MFICISWENANIFKSFGLIWWRFDFLLMCACVSPPDKPPLLSGVWQRGLGGSDRVRLCPGGGGGGLFLDRVELPPVVSVEWGPDGGGAGGATHRTGEVQTWRESRKRRDRQQEEGVGLLPRRLWKMRWKQRTESSAREVSALQLKDGGTSVWKSWNRTSQ